MIHLTKSLIRKLWLLFVLLLIGSALAILSARLLAPLASDFRADVETWASEILKHPVSIQDLSARWRGLGPELVFRGVSLLPRETDEQPLVLSELRVSLALVDSLLALAVKPRQITISGVQLMATRHSDGSLLIGGLEAVGGAPKSRGNLFRIPSRITLERVDLYWVNQLISASPVHLPNIHAELVNAGARHQLTISLNFPNTDSGTLEFRADIRGNPTQADDWSADFYAKGSHPAIQNLLNSRLPNEYRLASGRIDLEAWGSWKANRLADLEGDITLSGLRVERQSSDLPGRINALDFDALGAGFRWRQEVDEWSLDLQNIRLEHGQNNWHGAALSVANRIDDAGRQHLRLGTDFIRVQDLTRILSILDLPETGAVTAVRQLQPRSELHELRLLAEESDQGWRWSAQGEIDKFRIKPWQEIPGVENLQARFWANQDEGALALESRNSRLLFSEIFRQPLQLDRLSGMLQWRRTADGGWRITSDDLLAANQDIKTHTRIRLELPSDPDASMFIDLQSDFTDGNAANAHHYYPVAIMPDAVVQWLDRGILGGRIPAGSALVRGPLSDFPFGTSHNGRFQVLFRAEEMVIDYWPGWPRLTGIDAEVQFLQQGFDTWVARGRMFDSQIRRGHGAIHDLSGETPFRFDGDIEGPLADHFRILRESPLAGTLAAATEGISARGRSRTKLMLAIPLNKQQQLAVDGRVFFKGSELQLEAWRLPLENIQGELKFDHESASAKNVRATLLGNRLTLDVSPGARGEPTRIKGHGSITGKSLAQHWPQLGLERLSGRSDWEFELAIPPLSAEVATPVRYRFASALGGTALDLPAPFGKRANEQRDFWVTGEFGSANETPLYVHYGPLLDANLLMQHQKTDGFKPLRGNIRFNVGSAPTPQNGLDVRGRLADLDLQPWRALLAASGGDAGVPRLQTLQLHLDRPSYGQHRLDRLDIDLARTAQGLAGRLTSEAFDGDIQIPDDLDQQPIRARLSSLVLTRDDGKAGGRRASADPGPIEFDPRDLPAFDLEAAKVELNGHDLGKLRLTTASVDEGSKLKTLSLNSALLDLSANGQWLQHTAKEQRTWLNVSLSSQSLGRLIEIFGFDQRLEEAPADIDAQLYWTGTPLDFGIGQLNGSLNVLLGRGLVSSVKPGLGRILGLINIRSLQRRMSLDFSDLTKEGFAFDSVEGLFNLESGDAYTHDLRIIGPGARIEIDGRLGLASEDIDQLITVTPSVSSTLPVAGAIAGGPVGGVAMLLAQGLIGKHINESIQSQYQVTGFWSEPDVTTLKKPPASTSPQSGDGSAYPTDLVNSPAKVSERSVEEVTNQQRKDNLLQRIKNKVESSPPSSHQEKEWDLLGQ